MNDDNDQPNFGHHNSDNIQQRQDKVLQGRDNLKMLSAQKRAELDESKIFQVFRTEVSEMMLFVDEKKKLVREDSFKDGVGNINYSASASVMSGS